MHLECFSWHETAQSFELPARNAVRRGAASGEAGPTDLTDSTVKKADNAKTPLEDEYIGRGLPRSSTTVTTVSGDVLLPAASPTHVSAVNDRSAAGRGQVSRERRLGRAPPVYEASSVRQNLYVVTDRSSSQDRGEHNGTRYSRRRPSLENMQDIPIPGQPLVYNVNIVNALRSGKGSRTGPYAGYGPGQFRMTGRAPLAYDVSAEASSITVPLHSTGNEGYFASQDILQEQHISSLPQRKHSDVSSVMLTVSGRAGKPTRTGPLACWDWLIAKCSCLIGRSRSKENQLMSIAQTAGVKAPREFATLRAMAALAAATAATAVSDPTKAPHGDMRGLPEPGSHDHH
ncbi:hypothetical protein AHF37_12317 [Paragonimus kellicotti]|nr:hypothetical protein AHF37_12317 [Paragonimus kellicotti]